MLRASLVIGFVACGSRPTAPLAPTNRAPTVATEPELDSDGDGIPDVRDRCPNEPEDYDMFEDADGCPDPDDDHDGVPDEADMCPYTPGVDGDGCPEHCVLVTSIDDCFLTPFYSANGPEAQLAHAAAELTKYPEIREVRVTGNRLASESVEASRARVERVRKRLVELGVRVPIAIGDFMETDRVAGANDIFGLITKQRFSGGRFRSTECTMFGPIYRPARAEYHCR